MRRNPNRHAHPTLRDAVDVTRYWSLVDQREPDECWPWRGDTDDAGYGVFVWHGVKKPAHELALSFTTGEVRDPDLQSCHSCDNPPCCNPGHLRFDTAQGNSDDKTARGRHAKPNARITADDARAIRVRRAAGARQKDLAAQYGIGEGMVSLIVRGHRWKDAGGPIETARHYRRTA